MLRPLAPSERALLEFLLTQDFAGAAALRVQAQTIQTGGRSCDCGCSSFSLHPDRSVPAAPVGERVPPRLTEPT